MSDPPHQTIYTFKEKRKLEGRVRTEIKTEKIKKKERRGEAWKRYPGGGKRYPGTNFE